MKSFLASLFTNVSTKTWLIVAACVTVGAATVSTAAVVHNNSTADTEITTAQPPAPEGRKSPAGDIKVDNETIPSKPVVAEAENPEPAVDQDTTSEDEVRVAATDTSASKNKKSSGKSTGTKKNNTIPVVNATGIVPVNNTIASKTDETTTSEAASSDSSSSSGSAYDDDDDDDVRITGSISSIPETTPPDAGVTTASWTVEAPSSSDSESAENVAADTPEPKEQPDTDPVPVTPDEGFSINIK